jgi:hypothetical protein
MKYTFEIGKRGDIAGNIIIPPYTPDAMKVVVRVSGYDVWELSGISGQLTLPITLNLQRIGDHSKLIDVFCEERVCPTLHVTCRCFDSLEKRRQLASIKLTSATDYLCSWE